MKKLVHIVVASVLVLGCVETDISKKFSGDQVEQLLTGGDTKHWLVTEWIQDGERQPLDACGDSIRWVFELASADSISSYGLTFDSQCMLYDTVFFGSLTVSSLDEVFTDSLVFEGGDKSFMNLRYIRGDLFAVSYFDAGEEIQATLNSTLSHYLGRQVSYYLTEGTQNGNTKDWYLSSLQIDNTNQTLSECSDSLIWRFTQVNGGVALAQLEPSDSTCVSYESTSLGTFNISTDDQGYFTDSFQFIEGDISSFTVSSFSSESFSANYILGETEYDVVFRLGM